MTKNGAERIKAGRSSAYGLTRKHHSTKYNSSLVFGFSKFAASCATHALPLPCLLVVPAPISLQILLHELHIVLAYDRVNEWLFADWRGEQNLASVQADCRDMLRFLVGHRCHKLLNDNLHIDNLWSEAAEWVGAEFLPAYPGPVRAEIPSLGVIY